MAAIYGYETLKTSQRVRNAQVSLDLSVISDSVEEQTDFPCFLVSLQLCSRLGLVHIEVAFGN